MNWPSRGGVGGVWGSGKTRRFVKFFISISGSFGAECDKLPFGDWEKEDERAIVELRIGEGEKFWNNFKCARKKKAGKRASARHKENSSQILARSLRLGNRYSAFRGQLSAKSFAFRLVGTTTETRTGTEWGGGVDDKNDEDGVLNKINSIRICCAANLLGH